MGACHTQLPVSSAELISPCLSRSRWQGTQFGHRCASLLWGILWFGVGRGLTSVVLLLLPWASPCPRWADRPLSHCVPSWPCSAVQAPVPVTVTSVSLAWLSLSLTSWSPGSPEATGGGFWGMLTFVLWVPRITRLVGVRAPETSEPAVLPQSCPRVTRAFPQHPLARAGLAQAPKDMRFCYSGLCCSCFSPGYFTSQLH